MKKILSLALGAMFAFAAAAQTSKTLNIPATVTVQTDGSVQVSIPAQSLTIPKAAPPVVTPPATTSSKDAYLTYIKGLTALSTKRVLSGQTTEIWSNTRTGAAAVTQAMSSITPIAAATGKNVSILGVIMNDGNYVTNGAYDIPTGKALTQAWMAKGGLVQVSLYPSIPTSNAAGNGTVDGGVAPGATPLDAASFHQIAVPGSALYVNWHKQLDVYAAQIADWTSGGGVLLFRPFIELNGGWNWYGAENAADFIAIWKDMVTYLNVTKGLAKNLIWVFNVNPWQTLWSTYDPGANYRDVVGFDVYANTQAALTQAGAADNLYAGMVALKAPILLSEIGLTSTPGPAANTLDNTLLINQIKATWPNVIGFVNWCQGESIGRQKNASALMNDAWIVNLADLPAVR